VNNPPAATSELFQFADQTFHRLVGEFAAYGLFVNPGLELRQGNGVMCHTDLSDGNIYVSVPDLPDADSRLHALLLRSLTGCRDEARLYRFFQLLLPWWIAHELAHHYRREHGLFSASFWKEEQLANRLASAATKYRLSPEDENELRSLLEHAIDKLARQGARLDSAIDAADNLPQERNNSSATAGDPARNIEVMGRMFRTELEELNRAHQNLPSNVVERLVRGDHITGAFDGEHGSHAVNYMFFQFGWMFRDLCSHEQHYVDEFVRDGLQLTWPLLPRIERSHSEPEESEVRACFSAQHHAASASESGSRYFYKRYRALLLHKMAASADFTVNREIESVLEQWEDRDYETLDMAARFAPARLHGLFPRSIAREILPPSEVESHLACATDRRLWLHVVMGKQDENAARTLTRMTILEQAPIFRPLPAETLLDLSHSLCRVLIPEGDPIILEGRVNDDVYVLTKGRLSVSKRHGDGDVTVAYISPGEVFGEMAFLTRRPRSATVRAVEESECIMVKSVDLRLLAYRQPSVILQVARVLAQRLEAH
jgi:predicted metal-dependent hydrolase